MFDNFLSLVLLALGGLFSAIVVFWLTDARRIKRGDPTLELPWRQALLVGIAIAGIADVLT